MNAFIAVLAHELRNPLAPIRNAIHMLGHIDPKDQPAQEQLRQIIDRQSSQLSRIVDDLLDVNRVTRGALSMTPKPVDVAQLIARSTETARPNIEAGKHKLEIDIPPGPLQIEADEVRIVQALANLLNNAARYTDPGGSIFVRVKRLDRTTGPMVQITRA